MKQQRNPLQYIFAKNYKTKKMKDQNLAIKLKELRNRKGFSQEQLSEESNLSLRTIQRIESGESVPRGDSLIKLTSALGVTPDDILTWGKSDDKGYLTLLNLSALTGVLFHPILGIIIPLVMWILKKDKVNLVDNYGKNIISFQIIWTLLIYSGILIISKGSIIRFDINFFDVLSGLFTLRMGELIYMIAFAIVYGYNLVLIFYNFNRIKNGKKSWYFPSAAFLK